MKVKEIETKFYQLKNILKWSAHILSDMIKDHKTEGEWKIQLIMSINFLYLKRSFKNIKN